MAVRAVITGAAGGLGQAIVREFLRRGCTVFAIDIDNSRLADLKRGAETPGNLVTLRADVTSETECAEAVQTVSAHGGVDVLVNNAGMITRSSTADTTLEQWNRVLEVNLTGAFLMTRTALPVMQQSQRPRIINVASRAAVRPHKNAAPSYGASKAALVYLTRHWAMEYSDRGILCFCVSPGPVRTPMFDRLDAEYRKRIESEMVTGQAIESDEVARLIWYAASECGPSMTGQTFACNAGTSWG